MTQNQQEYLVAWREGFAAAVKAHAALIKVVEELIEHSEDIAIRPTLEVALTDLKANLEFGT